MIDLRDHFAAAALTGLLAAPTDKDRSWEYWARLAYEAADAMLRERGGVRTPAVSTGATGNQWFTIPPPPRKLDEEATLPP